MVFSEYSDFYDLYYADKDYAAEVDFDGWFGPAVFAQEPEKRRHEYREGENLVLREVTPRLDPVE